MYRYFNEFLMAHSRETAQQVRSEYMDTMGKIYYSYFKDYHSKLMKLQVCMIDERRLLEGGCLCVIIYIDLSLLEDEGRLLRLST